MNDEYRTTSDFISREELIEELNWLNLPVGNETVDKIFDVIENMPSAQPASNCSEIPNASEFVSRKAVREMVATWSYDMAEWEDVELALHDVDELPPTQPEVIHCMGNCPIKPNGYLAEAAQMVLDFIRKCEGNDAYITTPDGERPSSDWGYVEEGLEEIIRWAEGRKENG